VRAGQLRHRVEVQALTRTGDGQGGATESWATVATVWGAVTPLAGREAFNMHQVEPTATHQIVMRYQSNPVVTAQHQIKFGTRTFRILSVLNTEERKREIVLTCEEVPSA